MTFNITFVQCIVLVLWEDGNSSDIVVPCTLPSCKEKRLREKPVASPGSSGSFAWTQLGPAQCLPQIKSYLQLSVTTNHPLSWSDMWERPTKLEKPFSTCRRFLRARLNLENANETMKTSNNPQWSNTRRRPGVCCSAVQNVSHRKYSAVSSGCSDVIKASRSNLFNQDFLLLSWELNFKVTVHAVT